MKKISLFSLMIFGMMFLMQTVITVNEAHAGITQVSVGPQTGTLTAGVAGSVTYSVSVSYSNGYTYACYSLTYALTSYTPSTPTGVTPSWSGTPSDWFYGTNPWWGYCIPDPGTLTGVTLTLSTSASTPAGTYTFQVNVSGYLAETANANSADVTLVITGGCTNPTSGGTIASAQTICYNTTPNPLTSSALPSGHSGTLEYKWQSSTTGSSSDFADIGSATNTGYSPGALTQTTWFKRLSKVTCEDTWPVSGESNVIEITVRPQFSAGGISDRYETICYAGDADTIPSVEASGGDNVISYQWQSSTTNGTAGFSDIAGATTYYYDPPSGLTDTTWYRRLVKDGTCNTTLTLSYGVYQINVSPPLSRGEIETTGETICYNTSPTVTIGSITDASGGSGLFNYSWRSSSDGYTTSIIGANAATFWPAGPLVSTTSFRRYVEGIICDTLSTASTGTWTVTVRPKFTSGAIATLGESICYSGDPVEIGSDTASSGGDNMISYQWQSSTTSSIEGFADIGSATQSTYDPPSGLTATTWYRRMAKDSTCVPTFTTSGGVWQVTVSPEFTAGAINTTGETICHNGNPVLIGSATNASGGDDVISYQWQQLAAETDKTDDWIDITGATGSTYTPPAGLTASTNYRRLARDGTCNIVFTLSTGTWTVTVLPEFTAGAINTTGETICYNTDPNSEIGSATAAGGGDDQIDYSWRSSSDGFTTAISGATGSTYTPAGPLTETTSYRRYAADNTCNTTPAASTGTWTVTVIPVPSGGTVTGGTGVCYGTNSTLLTLTGHSGDVVKWQYSVDNSNWVDISSHTLTTYTAENVTEDTWYRAVVESDPCPEIYSIATQITVLGDFTISGFAKYDNNPKTPLNGLNITLKKDGTPLGAPVTTGNNGYYEFTGLDHGNYGIEISSAHPSGQWQTWGGVNNTDYLLVARHIAGTQFLPVNPPVVQITASVKVPHPLINTADATAIRQAAKYPATGYTYFDIPKWVFSGTETTTPLDNIEVVCDHVTRDIRGLCAGDVNGTYLPASGYKTASPDMQLVNRGDLPLTNEITFPVRVDRNMELGAVTLLLDFDPSVVMITGVEMPQNGGVEPWYSVSGSMLHIGWWTMDPVELAANDILILIHAKRIDGQSEVEHVRFTLNEIPLSELATGAGEVIHDAVLAIPDASSKASEMAAFNLVVFPNPAKDVVQMNYHLSSEAMVNFELMNSQGINVLKTARQLKDAGTHKESFDVKGWLPGVYLIQVTVGQQVYYRKLVVVR